MAHFHFVLNLIESFRQNLRLQNNLLIICLDDEIKDNLSRRGVPALKFSDLMGIEHGEYYSLDKDHLRSQQTYGTETYNRLVNMKIDVAFILLRYYDLKHLIYSDVDVVWLQPRLFDYFDFFFNPTGLNRDILFSASGNGTFYPCTGFYSVKKSNFSINFLGAVLAHPAKNELHDQQIAQLIYDDLRPDMKLMVHNLDPVLFVDGNTQTWSSYFDVHPWIFHANFVVGFEAKKSLLQQFGFWYL